MIPLKYESHYPTVTSMSQGAKLWKKLLPTPRAQTSSLQKSEVLNLSNLLMGWALELYSDPCQLSPMPLPLSAFSVCVSFAKVKCQVGNDKPLAQVCFRTDYGRMLVKIHIFLCVPVLTSYLCMLREWYLSQKQHNSLLMFVCMFLQDFLASNFFIWPLTTPVILT